MPRKEQDSSKRKRQESGKDQTTGVLSADFFRSWFQKPIYSLKELNQTIKYSSSVVDSVVSDKLTFFLMENGELA